MKNSKFCALFAIVLTLGAAGIAHAQSYPNKPSALWLVSHQAAVLTSPRVIVASK